ncbi:MAG: NADPH-dependent assimilatory sulfite reductase hemoprotein subunit [Alphaproteobacteria bacterium]|nr:NADPH-dependent assimilatory sulfite reductase hemoprotein subunit [Alphaproteobacteria bacterium]
MTDTVKKPSHAEEIKLASRYLRGDVSKELDDTSNDYVSDDVYELLKFHGSYFGYDRDTATERKKAGLEKHHEFMVRLRMPGGQLTAKQYLIMDDLCDQFANGTLRITTRETFQFHCIVKKNMKPFIKAINEALLSTLSACGDVVRNILWTSAPIKDAKHKIIEDLGYALAKHFAPQTHAYHEIWIDGENIVDPETEEEPIYGTLYLPRKFKIAIAEPLDNSVDAMTNDLAIIPFFNGQTLEGYNVCLGGGLGITHNKPDTYPRLATPIAYVKPEDIVSVSEAVVKLQRDNGDRTNRKHARLKYVVEENGIEWTRKTLESYFGKPLQDPRPMGKFDIPDHLGWHEQGDGKWWLGVPISSGRILDRDDERIRTGLRKVIQTYRMDLRLTADQNILLCNIDAADKADIIALFKEHGIKLREDISAVYRDFLACVALPTCGKALAEAERVKLPLVADLEKIMEKHGVLQEKIAVRMTGCPNGCARPYVGDIGIVGRTPDHYAIYIGGDFEGTRLNTKILDRVPFSELPRMFDVFFADYAQGKLSGEGYGDYVHRVGTDHVVTQLQSQCAGAVWLK